MRQDFECAKESILIVSPFIRKRRSENVLEWLKPAHARGIAIRMVTRPPENYGAEAAAAVHSCIAHLRRSGIDVTERAAIHQKFVLIDKRIVWYGSLNLLSFGTSEESLMRLASREVAAELERTIRPGTQP